MRCSPGALDAHVDPVGGDGKSATRARVDGMLRVTTYRMGLPTAAVDPAVVCPESWLAHRLGRRQRTIPARLTDHRRLRAAGAVGGLEVIRFRLNGPMTRPTGVRAEVRQLVLVPSVAGMPFLAHRHGVAMDVYSTTTLHRTWPLWRCQFVALAAVPWRYAPSDLRGDPTIVRRLLALRGGGRLSTGFGTLHGPTTR